MVKEDVPRAVTGGTDCTFPGTPGGVQGNRMGRHSPCCPHPALLASLAFPAAVGCLVHFTPRVSRNYPIPTQFWTLTGYSYLHWETLLNWLQSLLPQIYNFHKLSTNKMPFSSILVCVQSSEQAENTSAKRPAIYLICPPPHDATITH